MGTENEQTIIEYILDLEDQLDEAGQISANRAFNLGCWSGLVPVGLLSVVIFFLSGSSWVVTLVSALMLVISLIALANLAAYVAKSRSISRLYDERVKIEIDAKIVEFSLSKGGFDSLVVESLPQGSVLIKLRSLEEQ